MFCQVNKKTTLLFNPIFGKNNLALNDSVYVLEDKSTVKFETLKFYISSIQFYKNDKLVWSEKNSFHLINVETNKPIALNIPSTINFTQIRFNLGIDSTTNVSGALGGDLDPTKGMYWTWQSGYVNFKLEGSGSACKDAKKEFQFHLGGYITPFKAVQKIMLDVKEKEINIELDIKQFISSLDLSKQDHIMSPGIEAVKLSQALKKCFSIK